MLATGTFIDGSELRWATIRKTPRTLQILALQSKSLDVKPLYFERKGALISGLNSHEALLRTFPRAAIRNRTIKQALTMQMEAQLHFKPEELLTIPLLYLNHATLYSTTKTILTAHLEQWQQLGLDPDRVSTIALALKTFLDWKLPERSSCFFVHNSLFMTHCLWIEKGALQKAHAFNIDVNAERGTTYKQELLKILHSFQVKRPIIFSGEVDCQRFNLLEDLQDVVTEEKKIGISLDEHRFVIPLGLALDYLIHRKQPLQFRRAFSSSHNLRLLGRSTLVLFILAILLSLSFAKLGSYWMQQREQEIVENLKTWAIKDLRDELFAQNANTAGLVQKWIKLIEKNAKEYPFIMKAPKVAQLLHWLLPATRALSLERIHYELVSFPHLSALREPYLVKIDLEVTSPNPLEARRFHEMLTQDNPMVDLSREISWETTLDRIHTTFYLKNEIH